MGRRCRVKTHPDVCHSYMSAVLHPKTFQRVLKLLVDACMVLRSCGRDFDTIVFTGNSGTAIGPALAAQLNMQMLLVRKRDGHHASIEVEGARKYARYLIVDDLVATGKTIKRIIRELDADPVRQCFKSAVCVGMLQYAAHNGAGLDGPLETLTLEQTSDAQVDVFDAYKLVDGNRNSIKFASRPVNWRTTCPRKQDR